MPTLTSEQRAQLAALAKKGAAAVAAWAGKRSLDYGLSYSTAKRKAARYASEIGGTSTRMTFPDGERRFVVLKGGKPRAVFPDYDGDVGEVMADRKPARGSGRRQPADRGAATRRTVRGHSGTDPRVRSHARRS